MATQGADYLSNPTGETVFGLGADGRVYAIKVDANGNVLVSPACASTDGSSTVTTGGVAQSIFAAAIPTNGWAIYNPDPSEDMWVSDTATAAPNAVGSIRVAANGGGYESPPGRKPIGAVSVYAATTGHKFTASWW